MADQLISRVIDRHRAACGAEAGLPEVLIADRAYDSEAFVEKLQGYGITAIIPSRSNKRVQRVIDRQRYKNRNQVERFFGRLKRARRVATRYEKTARNFLAVVMIAACFT